MEQNQQSGYYTKSKISNGLSPKNRSPVRTSTTAGGPRVSTNGVGVYKKQISTVKEPAVKANRTNTLEAHVTRKSLRDQHNHDYISNREQAHLQKQRDFFEQQVAEGHGDNLATFVNHRVELQVEEEMLDHKTEIRRELAEHREDNHMQIEHHFREFHHRRWVDYRHYQPWARKEFDEDYMYNPEKEGQYVSKRTSYILPKEVVNMQQQSQSSNK